VAGRHHGADAKSARLRLFRAAQLRAEALQDGIEIEGAESVANFDNFQLNPNQPVTRGMRVYFRGKAPKGTEDYTVQLVFKDLRGNRYPTVEHRFKPLPIPERVDIQRGTI